MKLTLDNNIKLFLPKEISSFHSAIASATNEIARIYLLKNIEIHMMFFKEKRNDEISACIFRDHETKYNFYVNVHALIEVRFQELFCHELTHIKQYREERLESTENGVLWEGQLYLKSFVDDPENYWNLPWELEAQEAEAYSELVSKHLKSPMLTALKKLITSKDLMLTP